MNLDALAAQERITAYLASGGLFNPECANHDAVRDLLIDARAALAQAENSGIDKAIAYIREQGRTVYGDSFGILPPIIEGLEMMKGEP